MEQIDNTQQMQDQKESEIIQILIQIKTRALEMYNNIEFLKVLGKKDLSTIIQNLNAAIEEVKQKEQKYILKTNLQALVKFSETAMETYKSLQQGRQYFVDLNTKQESALSQLVDLKKQIVIKKQKTAETKDTEKKENYFKDAESQTNLEIAEQCAQTENIQNEQHNHNSEIKQISNQQDFEVNEILEEFQITQNQQKLNTQILISNLSKQLTNEQIKEFFGLFGNISNFKIIDQSQQQNQMNQALIEFEDQRSADLVLLRVQGYLLLDLNPLQVQLYQEAELYEYQENNQNQQQLYEVKQGEQQNLIAAAEKFLLEAQIELNNPQSLQQEQTQKSSAQNQNEMNYQIAQLQLEETDSISSSDLNELIRQNEINREPSVISDINSENYDVFPQFDLHSILTPTVQYNVPNLYQRSKSLNPQVQYINSQLSKELKDKKSKNLLISNISQTSLQDNIIQSNQQYQLHDYYESAFKEMLQQLGKINYISVFDDYENKNVAVIIEFQNEVNLTDILCIFPHSSVEALD